MKFTANKIAGILRQHGYKLTPQRHVILDVIAHSQEHLTPGELYEKVRQEHPGVGLVTIYRTIGILANLGLICQVHVPGDSFSYMMRRPEEHHHHLVCSQCGKVADFTDCDLTGLEDRLSQGTGFEIQSHLLEFHGRCPDCQKVEP